MSSRQASRTARAAPARRLGADGSTLVETMLAASLTVLAAGMLVGNVIVPLSTLDERVTADGRAAELHAAADGLARIVRAARTSRGHGPVLAAGMHELVLQVGTDGTEVTVSFGDEAVLISTHAVTAGGAPLPSGRLVHGIDVAGSGFVLLGSGGVPVDTPRDAVAVGFHLVDGPHHVARVVALRDPVSSGTGEAS